MSKAYEDGRTYQLSPQIILGRYDGSLSKNKGPLFYSGKYRKTKIHIAQMKITRYNLHSEYVKGGEA